MQTWAISVKGPTALGDGTYSSLAAFNGMGGTFHVSFVNVVQNSTLKTSKVASTPLYVSHSAHSLTL